MMQRRLLLAFLGLVILAGGCSETTAPGADGPVAGAEFADAAADPLDFMEEMLPDEFGILTDTWLGDLDGMADRHVIRTLVVAGGPQFFYYEGRPRGMVAELLVALQAQLNEELGRELTAVEIVPMPVSRDRLIPALIKGHADLIAADLTVTEQRSELIDFSVPLVSGVDEVLVFAAGEGADVITLEDLAGRAVFVRRSSSYFEHLAQLNETFVERGLQPVKIEEAHELLRAEDILEMVNAGIVSATVIDSYKASFWSEIFTEMKIRNDLVVHSGGEIAWAFRKDSPQLEAVVNRFVREHRQGTLIGNVLIRRYMENLEWVRNATSESGAERLQPLLEMFRESGEEVDLDPLMLAAQAYQESELDSSKTSPAGAVGIMQIKPSTAADPNVNVPNVEDPANNIRAAAIYMRFLMDRYFSEPGMEQMQSWLFALAAYNAGPAKIQQIRRLATEQGYDPNLWVDNVELAAAKVLGRETVRYVRNIFKYFVAYRLAWEHRLLREELSEDIAAGTESQLTNPP